MVVILTIVDAVGAGLSNELFDFLCRHGLSSFSAWRRLRHRRELAPSGRRRLALELMPDDGVQARHSVIRPIRRQQRIINKQRE
jgi:hypothetical protein